MEENTEKKLEERKLETAQQPDIKQEDDAVQPVAKEVAAEEVAEILSGLSKEERETIVGAMVRIEQRTFSGPLPHPELFQGYEQTQPGAANRILTMSEKEQDHRHDMEKAKFKQKCRKQNRGQVYGCVLAVFFALVAFALSILGHEIIASVIFGTTILGVLVIYVLGIAPDMARRRSEVSDEDEDDNTKEGKD